MKILSYFCLFLLLWSAHSFSEAPKAPKYLQTISQTKEDENVGHPTKILGVHGAVDKNLEVDLENGEKISLRFGSDAGTKLAKELLENDQELTLIRTSNESGHTYSIKVPNSNEAIELEENAAEILSKSTLDCMKNELWPMKIDSAETKILSGYGEDSQGILRKLTTVGEFALGSTVVYGTLFERSEHTIFRAELFSEMDYRGLKCDITGKILKRRVAGLGLGLVLLGDGIITPVFEYKYDRRAYPSVVGRAITGSAGWVYDKAVGDDSKGGIVGSSSLPDASGKNPEEKTNSDQKH